MSGNPIVDKIIVAINLILVLGGVGGVIFSHQIKPDRVDPEEEYQRMLSEAREVENSKPYSLRKMTVNLRSERSRLHFLDLEVHIRPYRMENFDQLEQNKAMISDTVIRLSAALEPSDLNNLSGKMQFADSLKREINQRAGDKIAREIFFSRFVIQ